MADDIFLTPEEQDERARKWLKENGPALAIGIALGLGAIFGWNQYKAKMQRDAETASELYTAAIEELNSYLSVTYLPRLMNCSGSWIMLKKWV